jgi:hypothetical protein
MQRSRSGRIALVAMGWTLLLGAVACGEDQPTSEEPVVVDITVEDGVIEPSGERIDVGAGQPIDLVVTADEPGSIHVHSDPEQEFAYEAGTETFPIQIDRPGVVEVESHDPAQIIVQLEVR